MKNAVFLLLFTVFAAFAGHAQQFKAGATLGFSTTQIDGDGYAGWNKAGVVGGLFVNSPISKKIEAEFQMTYIMKGSQRPADPDNGNFDYYRISMGYIEVPLLFRWKGRKFFYEAGPSLGVLIASHEEDINGEVPLPFHDFKSTEFALHLGLGYKITDKIHTNVRLSHSVTPVSNEAKLTRWGIFGGSYNQAIIFALKYQFLS